VLRPRPRFVEVRRLADGLVRSTSASRNNIARSISPRYRVRTANNEIWNVVDAETGNVVGDKTIEESQCRGSGQHHFHLSEVCKAGAFARCRLSR